MERDSALFSLTENKKIFHFSGKKRKIPTIEGMVHFCPGRCAPGNGSV